MNIEQYIEKIPFSTGCSVVKFDACGLVAINKKAGRATHPNPGGHTGSKPPMVRANYNFKGEYYYWRDENGQVMSLYLVNRLDSPTSGIVIASAVKEVAEAAKRAFKEKSVIKTYISVLIGRIKFGKGTWMDYLKETSQNGFVRSAPSKHGGGMKALTSFRALAAGKGYPELTLAELTPQTGLTHQLRVQAAKHAVPILGDATYGNFKINKLVRARTKINRLFLHCAKTELKINIADKQICFCAEVPPPESFKNILELNDNPRFK